MALVEYVLEGVAPPTKDVLSVPIHEHLDLRSVESVRLVGFNSVGVVVAVARSFTVQSSYVRCVKVEAISDGNVAGDISLERLVARDYGSCSRSQFLRSACAT